MAVQIKIDQASKPAGVAGQAREDLDVSTAVTLSAVGGPFTQYQWTIIDAPPNAGLTAPSSSTLGTPTLSTTTITPDNDGTYLLQLAVNAGYGLGTRDEDVTRITFYAGATLNAVPSKKPRRVPSFYEQLEHNVPDLIEPSGNTEGWAREWRRWFLVLSTIPAPLSPSEDDRVAFANSGVIDYADGVTVANSGGAQDGLILSSVESSSGALRIDGKTQVDLQVNSVTQAIVGTGYLSVGTGVVPNSGAIRLEDQAWIESAYSSPSTNTDLICGHYGFTRYDYDGSGSSGNDRTVRLGGKAVTFGTSSVFATLGYNSGDSFKELYLCPTTGNGGRVGMPKSSGTAGRLEMRGQRATTGAGGEVRLWGGRGAAGQLDGAVSIYSDYNDEKVAEFICAGDAGGAHYLSMASHQIKDLAAPVDANDAVRLTDLSGAVGTGGLAGVLGVGDTTGAHDIEISAGQKLTSEAGTALTLNGVTGITLTHGGTQVGSATTTTAAWGHAANVTNAEIVGSTTVKGKVGANTILDLAATTAQLGDTTNTMTATVGASTTAYLDVGATHELAVTSGHVAVGADAGQTGCLGIPNNENVTGRNNAGSADVLVLKVTTADKVQVGGANATSVLLSPGGTEVAEAATATATWGHESNVTVAELAASTTINIDIGAAHQQTITANDMALGGDAAYTITRPTHSSGHASATSIVGQDGATGAYNGGDFIFKPGADGGSGNNGTLQLQDADGNTKVEVDSTGVGFNGNTPVGKSAAYTRNATVVEDRTLLASASATTTNNNNVLAALIADLQAAGHLG